MYVLFYFFSLQDTVDMGIVVLFGRPDELNFRLLKFFKITHFFCLLIINNISFHRVWFMLGVGCFPLFVVFLYSFDKIFVFIIPFWLLR